MAESPERGRNDNGLDAALSARQAPAMNVGENPVLMAHFPKAAEVPESTRQVLPDVILTGGPSGKQNAFTQIDYFRQKLKAEGIDPDKVSSRIVVRELDSPDSGDSMGPWHAGTVACSINDPYLGLSRNLKISMINDQLGDAGHKESEFPETLEAAVVHDAVRTITEFTKTLKEQFLNTDNPARILNVSNGGSNVDVANSLYGLLADNPQRYAGTIKQLLGPQRANEWIKRQLTYPNQESEQEAPVRLTEGQLNAIRKGECPDLRRAPLNNSPEPPKHPQLLQKLIEFTEKTLAESNEFQQNLAEYRETAKQIADRGGIIVVAAGNNGDFSQRFGVRLNEGAEYNWFALSDHVITVGASADSGKRGDPSDDRPALFSSSGTWRYRPTVLALGEDFPTRLHPSGKIDGTSYAAPLVANVIGLMLEQNPSLGFSQVSEILKQNSRRISGIPQEKQGHGILHIDKAVLAARDRAKR